MGRAARVAGVVLVSGAVGIGGAALVASQAGRSPASLAENASESCGSLGTAGQFNLFADGNFSAVSGDVQGLLAVGGNASLENFTVDSANDSAFDGASLAVGGNLTFHGGSIGGNHVADYRGTLAESSVSPGTFDKVGSGQPFSFTTALGDADAESHDLADLSQPGYDSVTAGPGGALELSESGTHSSSNVFDVSASELSSRGGVLIDVNPGSTVVINVSGSSVDFGDLSYVTVNGSQAASAGVQVLWNFPSAGSITYGSSGLDWLGSILAPKADITFGSGQYHGNVIVGGNAAYSSGSELHTQLFDGCLPVPSTPPGDTTPVLSVGGPLLGGLTAVAGGTVLFADRRRRGGHGRRRSEPTTAS